MSPRSSVDGGMRSCGGRSDDQIPECGPVVVDGRGKGAIPVGELPGTLVEDAAQKTAIGVVPAGEAGGPPELTRFAEYGLRWIEGIPGPAVHAAEAEGPAVDVFYIGDRLAEEQAGDDFFRVIAGGPQAGEGGAALRELLEVGEGESGGTLFEDLIVGEFVHENPDDARLRG